MITCQVESISSCIEELKELNKEHWEEIALYQSTIKLNVDYSRYIELNESGYLQFCTIRKDERLVGYCCDFVHTSLHYSDNVFAMNDVLFVSKEFRSGTFGIRLLKFTESVLKDKSVSVWQIHTKTHKSIAPILIRCGFELVESQYGKLLEEP